MKIIKRITALTLVLCTAFILCSCGTYAGIQKSFLDAGYTAVKTDENNVATSISTEINDADLKTTFHLFKTDGLLGVDVYALVIEFESESVLKAYLSDDEETSATLKGFLTDSQKLECVNGNCLLVPLSITKYSEMLEIFKKTK